MCVRVAGPGPKSVSAGHLLGRGGGVTSVVSLILLVLLMSAVSVEGGSLSRSFGDGDKKELPRHVNGGNSPGL